MGELTELLRTAREAKGLTLRDISDRTRIGYTFLEAIEEENFSVIPGEIFVTGFLRTYARELGLNEKETVAVYNKLKAASPEAGKPEASSAQAASDFGIVSTLISKLTLSHIIIAGLVLGALLIAVLLLVTRDDGPQPVATPPQPSSTSPSAVPFGVTTSGMPGQPLLDNVTSTLKPASDKNAASAPLVLKVEAAGNCWYSYRIDGGERLSGAMKNGERLDVEANDKIILSLGNAGVVTTTFNGKPVAAFGPIGAVRKGILFTKDIPGKVMTPNPE